MLPKDPVMLYSVVNTKLRDEYENLEALCSAEGISESELKKTLADVGFEYIEAINQFR